MNDVREFPDGTRIVAVDQDDGATDVRLEAAGELLSRTFIVPLLMRIGASVVRMDGIGGVETGAAHRNRGYSRRVLEAAVDLMRAGEASISTLYGIPNYYPKFGYATSGPEYASHLELEADDAPPAALPEGWTFRPLTAGDLPDVRRLYATGTRRATGAIVRDEDGDPAFAQADPAARKVSGRPWQALAQLDRGTSNDACRVLVDAVGKVAGYAWLGRSGWWVQGREDHAPEAVHIGEAMARDPESADALLAAARLWAMEAGGGTRRAELIFPPEGVMGNAAAHAGAACVSRYSWQGEFMARVLDTGRLIRQLQPEMSERVRRACAGFAGTVVVRADEGETRIGISPDGVSLEPEPGDAELVVELPQETLARLALGAFDASDLLARLPVPVPEDAVRLLEVLFPRRHPHIHAMDRF